MSQVNNYAKVMGGYQRDMFFPFNDRDVILTHRALTAAREYSKSVHGDSRKAIVVWKRLDTMPDDVRCVGHAVEENRGKDGSLRSTLCLNCGQIIFHVSNGVAY